MFWREPTVQERAASPVPCSVPFDRRVMGAGVDAAHDAILADGDAHLALNHEGNAAKHFLFLDTAAFSYSRSYAICQSFTRWHRGCLLGRPWQ